MMERVPQQLRPFVLLAPGAVLLVTLYWFDYPNPDAGAAYPAHAWSTAGAVAGWWLELAALALIGRTQMIGWLALFSALAIGSVNGDNATLLTSAALPYAGLFGASLVLLFASSGAVLSAYGRRGRIAWSIAFASIGIAIIVFNSIFPSNPIWGGPVGVWAASLVAAPVFIWVRSLKVNYVDAPTESKGAPGPTVGETQIPPSSSVAPQGEAVQWPESSGSLFKGGVFGEEASSRGSVETMANTAGELTSSDRFRFGPPKQRWLAGCPFWGWFWLITVLWAITIAAQPFRHFGASDNLANGGAILVVILLGAGTAVLGPRVQLWSQLWLDSLSREWEQLDSRALALQRCATHHSSTDENPSQAETLYRRALEMAESSKRPLLIATSCNNLAGVYADENRMQDAIPLFERALQLRKAYAGANNVATIYSTQRLSAAYSVGGRKTDAAMLNTVE